MKGHRKLIPEDFSADLRTLLAKERTILAYQSVQLNKIGLALGVFATALAIARFFFWGPLGEGLAVVLMILALIVGVRAYMQYYSLARDLKSVRDVEEGMAYSHRKKIFDKEK